MAASVTKALAVAPSPSTGSPKRRTSYGATAEYGFNRHPDFVNMEV